MNRTAAVSQTSRSTFECAAAGFQHSRGPVHEERETVSRSDRIRTLFGSILR